MSPLSTGNDSSVTARGLEIAVLPQNRPRRDYMQSRSGIHRAARAHQPARLHTSLLCRCYLLLTLFPCTHIYGAGIVSDGSYLCVICDLRYGCEVCRCMYGCMGIMEGSPVPKIPYQCTSKADSSEDMPIEF